MDLNTSEFVKLQQHSKVADITLRRLSAEQKANEPEKDDDKATMQSQVPTQIKEEDEVTIQIKDDDKVTIQSQVPAQIKKKEEKVETKKTVPASIKVIGVGGGGCNAVRRMLKKQTAGVEYVVCNTDIKSLESVSGVESVQIGERITRGFGAGGDATVGGRAAEEGRFALKRSLKDADLVFITAGMGGGTGTGAAPVVAQIAKESRALVIAIVTTPFSFEGKKRFQMALGGIRRLRQEVDSVIIIHNDRLLQFMESNVPTTQAFATADDALAEGVLSVSQLVNVPGEINVDLADVKTVMSIPGGALMAIGRGDGARYPAMDAAEQAISNPLLDIDVKGAKGVLFNFSGGPDLTLGEVNDAANFIAREIDPNAIIFFGMTAPSEELKGTVKLTLVATGIHPDLPKNWLAEMGETLREAVMGPRRKTQ